MFNGTNITLDSDVDHDTLKKLIRFLECSWNHDYFGSLAKVSEALRNHAGLFHS